MSEHDAASGDPLRPRLIRVAYRMGSAEAFYAASRSGDLTTLGALLAADVSFHVDGGGKRPAAQTPILGFAQVMTFCETLAGLFHSELLRTGFVNGLPGFVTREADDELQTTALELEDGKVSAIYVVRNPDKLKHLH